MIDGMLNLLQYHQHSYNFVHVGGHHAPSRLPLMNTSPIHYGIKEVFTKGTASSCGSKEWPKPISCTKQEQQRSWGKKASLAQEKGLAELPRRGRRDKLC